MEGYSIIKLNAGEKLPAKAEGLLKDLEEWLFQEAEGLRVQSYGKDAIPTIGIKQGLTQNMMCPATLQNGQLYSSCGEALPDSIIVIPCAMVQSRIYINDSTKKMECFSLNCKQGSIYGSCRVCDKAIQTDPKLRCKSKLTALVLLDAGNRLYKIDFRGTSFMSGNKIAQFTMKRKTNIWLTKFKLSTKQEEDKDKGFSYYIFDVKVDYTPVTEPIAKLAQAIQRQYLSEWDSAVKEWESKITSGEVPKATSDIEEPEVVIDENNIVM